ncbi:MAG: putative prokaryotic signal transducing protein [Solirubrobacterales bacterium]|nr:putative prokaryotic signal transducing protein [Solirubrobacterales bacterium]
MLKVVASVSSEPESELVSARLSEAGIQAIAQRSIGGPEWGYSGARDIYVEEADLSRAREVLKGDEGVSEDELADLSDAARSELKEPDAGG